MSSWAYDGMFYRRRPTRTVRVGDVEIGSAHPLRVQSMTTPATKDTAATVLQIERLVAAGCEIVRVTVPTTADADSLPAIRSELERRGLRVPLVADIHFTPAAAMRAVEHVDKVRVNPGNYADKKKFAVREYTDAQYEAELVRIRDAFSPLVLRARELGVSMRIGTNHGSLSDRIMNRYGDSPEGMVESALEFVRICRDLDYHELVLSMKSSNPVVVQQVYRLLAQSMTAEGMDYPFHLGVTEAGDGEDGRIKSALGIGTLLEEGLGDTVRVSLTEDPVAEIPVALRLVEKYNRLRAGSAEPGPGLPHALRTDVVERRDPFTYAPRMSAARRLGPHRLGAGSALVDVPLAAGLDDRDALRRELDAQAGVRVPEETRAEVVTVDIAATDTAHALAALKSSMELVAPRVALSARIDAGRLADADGPALHGWFASAHRLHVTIDGSFDGPPGEAIERWLRAAEAADSGLLIEASGEHASGADPEAAVDLALEAAEAERRAGSRRLALALAPSRVASPLQAYRLLAARLAAAGHDTPLVLVDDPRARGEDPLLAPAIAVGGLLCDGSGDAVQLRGFDAGEARRLAFGILQAARVRITKTEFISCPSCGRTLFDLEATTARIKARTAHLKGVKIAVMGCIVNGPGEMADADFGYVGWGEDKIALFVGREMVAKEIPTSAADERLVELIKRHGRWVDPPVPAAEDP